MIINILMTIWAMAFSVIVTIDYTPCHNSIKKSFMFLSGFIVGVLLFALIWSPYLFNGGV